MSLWSGWSNAPIFSLGPYPKPQPPASYNRRILMGDWKESLIRIADDLGVSSEEERQARSERVVKRFERATFFKLKQEARALKRGEAKSKD